MKKRIISTLLAAAMLLAFASCGQTPTETTATTATTQTTQTTTAETTTAETTTEATEMTTDATTAETTTEETTTEQSTTVTEPAIELVVEFDEENIVLSFGAISDIHIGNFNAADESNFKRALEMLQAEASAMMPMVWKLSLALATLQTLTPRIKHSNPLKSPRSRLFTNPFSIP